MRRMSLYVLERDPGGAAFDCAISKSFSFMAVRVSGLHPPEPNVLRRRGRPQR